MANVYFSDWFNVPPQVLKEYGAFNISLVNDLPLFIDPFLLFTNENKQYRDLHDLIIRYLKFLRERAAEQSVDKGLLAYWYRFPEVKQLWLGFSKSGNGGNGLGPGFARTLHESLYLVFKDFGDEKLTKGSHLEKLCLFGDGVGRDHISDFTANLIKTFLAEYTQAFAKAHIDPKLLRTVKVEKAQFDHDKGLWVHRTFMST